MRWRDRGRWVGKSVRDDREREREREREPDMEEDMGWRKRGGDEWERVRDGGRYEMEKEGLMGERERVRDCGRYRLERKGEMGGREIQRWRMI